MSHVHTRVRTLKRERCVTHTYHLYHVSSMSHIVNVIYACVTHRVCVCGYHDDETPLQTDSPTSRVAYQWVMYTHAYEPSKKISRWCRIKKCCTLIHQRVMSRTNKSSRISMSRIHARVWNLKKDIIIVPREKALETNTSTNHVTQQQVTSHIHESCIHTREKTGIIRRRGGGLGSSAIFKKFNEPYAPS